jgi:hypothetical protein
MALSLFGLIVAGLMSSIAGQGPAEKNVPYSTEYGFDNFHDIFLLS